MADHLRVVPLLVDDADSLGDLERMVVQTLEPALNLDHVRAHPSSDSLETSAQGIGRAPDRLTEDMDSGYSALEYQAGGSRQIVRTPMAVRSLRFPAGRTDGRGVHVRDR